MKITKNSETFFPKTILIRHGVDEHGDGHPCYAGTRSKTLKGICRYIYKKNPCCKNPDYTFGFSLRDHDYIITWADVLTVLNIWVVMPLEEEKDECPL